MDKFYEKVNKLLEEYIGGQIFFTELDKAVKFDKDILEQLLTYVRQQTFMLNAKTIASGEIGLALHNFGLDVDLLVPGGLRHDPSKINLEPFKHIINDRNIIFIDDSYFSGRTATVIEEEISRCGGNLTHIFVAYDGSRERNEKVYSLYRYYDHYDILGRPIKKEG